MEYMFSTAMAALKPSAIREILKVTADKEVISFAAGNPAPETFPVTQLQALACRVLETQSSQALQYGVTEGYAPLRQSIADRLQTKYQIGRDFDSTIVVSGAQQGIELTAKVLCNPGDTVLCEDPSFIGALNSFRAHGLQLHGLRMDEQGLRPDALEHALQTVPRVKILYTIPTHQNPTGLTMSAERRPQILALCQQYGVYIIEDNPYGDLSFDAVPPPAIKTGDTEGIVIYVGSFSKIIAPGIRLGYVCAPAPIVDKIVVAKQAADVHSNLFFQMIVHAYMTENDIDAHIQNCCDLYRTKRDQMVTLSRRYLSSHAEVYEPKGGLFLWCVLRNEQDSTEFCRKAAAQKVAVVPGSAFLADTTAKTAGFRLNFSLPTPAQIDKGMAILGSIIS